MATRNSHRLCGAPHAVPVLTSAPVRAESPTCPGSSTQEGQIDASKTALLDYIYRSQLGCSAVVRTAFGERPITFADYTVRFGPVCRSWPDFLAKLTPPSIRLRGGRWRGLRTSCAMRFYQCMRTRTLRHLQRACRRLCSVLTPAPWSAARSVARIIAMQFFSPELDVQGQLARCLTCCVARRGGRQQQLRGFLHW